MKWYKPSERLPQVWVGDRVAVIVAERPFAGERLRPYLVLLTAVEGGWRADNPVYSGYTPEDGVLWALEDRVTDVAYDLVPEAFAD